MIRVVPKLVLALLLLLALTPAANAQEAKPPEFVGIKVGIADRYKVGVWTPIEVTLRGGSSPAIGRVRASLADSDGLTCAFDAPEPSQLLPGQPTNAVLYVRFGREASTIGLELLDGHRSLASRTIDSSKNTEQDQFPDSLGPEQRLIVSVGKSLANFDKCVPGAQGQSPQNVIAAVDSLAGLPSRWEGYDSVDFVVIATSRSEVFEKIDAQNARIEALDQWVRMGGTLVLCAGSNADAALHAASPLARFLSGHFEKTELLQATAVLEAFAKSSNPMSKPGENVKLPVARLSGVQGKIEAQHQDVPLVIRNAYGLGQVVFLAADLDRGPIRDWSDRPALVAALLNLPANVRADDSADTTNYGYTDLAGQLRSALDQPRDVRLVPFFVVALLVIAYILLIGPGDYFLLRRLGRGMHWTWITFPTIVIVFSVGAYVAAYWLKGDQLRVNQIDLVDIDSEGTARGASWFSIFSPRGESFDLSMRPRLPDGQIPQQATVSLGWLGKAGEEFNGMYRRGGQDAAPLFGQGYAIAPSLDAIHEVPIQVWASKSFVQRWLGHAPKPGVDASLTVDERQQLAGTIVNRLAGGEPAGKNGIKLSHCFLAYDSWAYVLPPLKPGEAVEIGSATRRISLSTLLSGDSLDYSENSAATPYDKSSRDMAYVLQRMMFYDAAGGRKRTGMTNDYQAFTDLSGLLKTGRAILVGMPPDDGPCRGGDLLRGPAPSAGETDGRQPLGNALDRHSTILRFVLPVTATQTN